MKKKGIDPLLKVVGRWVDYKAKPKEKLGF
jgi:hypothetical protein